ncbi:MAG: hypothetical protein IID44_29905 [Planctomycetes bacterium]|nr:hypothetical protein [Planctomycetota bacterium]
MNLKIFVRIDFLVIVIWWIGISLGYIPEIGLGPLSGALFAIAVVTFMGTLRASGDMRTAIAASFVMIYFALLAALATSAINRDQIDNPVGTELWKNFTYLVGVIIVFYFGSTATVEVIDRIYGAKRDAKSAASAKPPQPPEELPPD